MTTLDRRPRPLARARLAGGSPVRARTGGERPPGGARPRRGLVSRAGSTPPGRLATRPAGSCLWDFAHPRAEGLGGGGPALGAFASDETALTFLRRPGPPEGATRFEADLQVFEAAQPRARVSYWRLGFERRAGRWVDRVPPGVRPGRRPGAPLAGAIGLAGARGVAAARGLRAPDGGRDALLDPREPGPDRLRLRGPRAGPLLPGPAGRARTAPPVLGSGGRSTARSPGPSCACTPPTSTARSRRAFSSRRRTRASDGPRRKRVWRDRSSAQLHHRRATSPLPVVADAEPRATRSWTSPGAASGS